MLGERPLSGEPAAFGKIVRYVSERLATGLVEGSHDVLVSDSMTDLCSSMWPSGRGFSESGKSTLGLGLFRLLALIEN